jgi:colicin import membrane protein
MSKFHPMAMLLKYEGYPSAVIAAIALHACLLVFIFGRNVQPSDYVTIEDPVVVTATAVDVNPQRLRRIERIQEEQAADARRRQEQEARARREQEEQARQTREARAARERTEAEQRRQDELERQRLANAEAERLRQAEIARTRNAEEERIREQQRLAQEQADREAQSSQLASEDLLVAEYAGIVRRIISQNWNVPPNARNGMMATVELRLVPTGEVVGATVIQSSGDGVFDRSVLQAVERADRFPELQDMERGVFDRHFRTFTLVFRPEDLLR